MEFTDHALLKCERYGILPALVMSGIRTRSQTFLDTSKDGSRCTVFTMGGRPWVAVLTADESKVITVYPTDERTLENRQGGGRWLSLND